MNIKRAKKIGAVISITSALMLPGLRAGTVITANLPANTAIVNVNGQADGAANYNGSQALWYHPFNTNNTLLEYTVQPGTYRFEAIDPVDAAARFPSLTPVQTNQIYTAWSYNYPFILDYLVFDSSAETNGSVPQLFDGAQDIGYTTASEAYSNSIVHGTYNQLHVGPQGRLSTTIAYTYAFTKTTTLIFVVPDYALSDNKGGVSVLVIPAPVISIGLNGASIALQWPTNNSSGYILAQTTNLSTGVWSDVEQVPSVVSSNYSVMLPITPRTNHFFRLHNP